MLARHLADFCQLGYVTRDLDAAMAHLKSRSGIREFAVYDADLDVIVGGRPDRARIKVALANIGATQVEIIEPVEGAVEIYRDRAPASDVFLHHVASLVPGGEADWEQALAGLRANGERLAIEGEGGRAWGTLTRFAYVDARDRLGHFVELIWRSPGAQAAHEALPDQHIA